MVPVLILQPHVPVDLQQRAANLFGGCGSGLSCEAAPDAVETLRNLEIHGGMVGLRLEADGDEAPDCGLLAAGLQDCMQLLMQDGLTSFYLSIKGAGCDWAGLALDNGMLFVRAELHSLAELSERLHPWRAGAGGWDSPSSPEAEGELVIFPSSIPVNCKSELASSVKNPPCVLDQSDVDVTVWEVEQTLAELDDSRFTIYVLPVFVEREGDVDLLEEMLEKLQAALDSGQVRQVHLAELYDLFLAWEGQGE
jgi:hypothetical protein